MKTRQEQWLHSLVNSSLSEYTEGSIIRSIDRWETGWEQGTVDPGMFPVLGGCITRSVLYLVCTVLGIYCTQCQLMLMACRDTEGWINLVLWGHGSNDDEKERDKRRWETILRNWDSRELNVWDDLPFLIRQVWLPINQVITPVTSGFGKTWRYLGEVADMQRGCGRNCVTEKRRGWQMRRNWQHSGSIIWYNKEVSWGVVTLDDVVWLY